MPDDRLIRLDDDRWVRRDSILSVVARTSACTGKATVAVTLSGPYGHLVYEIDAPDLLAAREVAREIARQVHPAEPTQDGGG